MDKIKINLTEKEWIKIEPYGFYVKPYLSNMDQVVLISNYLTKMFSENETQEINHFKAENQLMISVLELNTNIELLEEVKEGDEGSEYFTLDDLYSHWDIWEKTEKAILNFSNFKMKLLKAVEMERENIRLHAGLGKVLDGLYTRATAYLDSLLDKEFSDEQMNKAKELLKEANESPMLKTIVEKLN